MSRKKMIEEEFSKPVNKYILKDYSAIASVEELTKEMNNFCIENDAEVVDVSFVGVPKVLYRRI